MALDSLFARFHRLILLDVETSGLDPDKDEIIELAAVLVTPGADGALRTVRLVDTLVLMPAGRKLPQLITRLTGIREVDLAAKGVSRSSAAATAARLFCEGNVLLVAYNAQFDYLFLESLLRKEGFPLPSSVSILDLLTVFRDRRRYPHRLEDAIAAYSLGEVVSQAHRAMNDALALLPLLLAMDKERANLDSYVNVLGFNPNYGVSGRRISGVRYVAQPLGLRGRVGRP